MCKEKKKLVPICDVKKALMELVERGKQEGMVREEELSKLLKDCSDDDADAAYEYIAAANIRVIFEDDEDLESLGNVMEDPAELAFEYGLHDPVRMYLKEIGRIKLLLSIPREIEHRDR